MLDFEAIKKILPHRYPMLLIDRVLEIDAGTSCKALKNISGNELFFQGHFPEKPLMPGVLIVEAIAQTAGIVIYSHYGEAEEGVMIFFGGIEKARFKRQVVPGDQLILEATLTAQRKNLWIFKGTGTVEGRVAAQAVVKLVTVSEQS